MSRATVTVKLQMADSRQEFVARQVTVVVPRMKTAPEGGVQVTTALVGQLPVVVGAGYVTTAVLATPHSQLVRSGGQVMRRGMDSWARTSTAGNVSRERRRTTRKPDRKGVLLRPNGARTAMSARTEPVDVAQRRCAFQRLAGSAARAP